jgi:urocanate hydratase
MRVPVRPATGTRLRCRGWRQEGILRLLENTLANAARPADLVVYGGTGQAARDWPSLRAIEAALRELGDDETLLVQSGRPVAVFRTFDSSPRVLIANGNLVPRAATHEEFFRLRDAGLTMHGQYTAGSWAYIGSQGILQGTFETFAGCAERCFGGSLRGRIVVTAGLGGMSSAQPPAITMNGGVALIAEVDAERIERSAAAGRVEIAGNLDDAWERCRGAAARGEAVAVALHANAADVLASLASSNRVPDVVTDQTSAHDLLHGYVPSGLDPDGAAALRKRAPDDYLRRARETVARHARAMLALRDAGAITFEYGNDLRVSAATAGVEQARSIDGFVPLFVRPSFSIGRGPVRWVCLSGDEADRDTLDAAACRLFPDDERLQRWIAQVGEVVGTEGLPARICWLGHGARARMALEINRLVGDGTLAAPVAITRDHLDAGACAYPSRETEDMPDGSDAIADWPYLDALLNASCGAECVSIHQNAGAIGGSASAGMTVICDGSREAGERIDRVFEADPGIGVVRHASAGVAEAREYLGRSGIHVPPLSSEPT